MARISNMSKFCLRHGRDFSILQVSWRLPLCLPKQSSFHRTIKQSAGIVSKIAVLGFSNIQDIERKDYTSLDTLTQSLNLSSDETRLNRLIVCEDLSSGLIELLVSSFDVDTRFFRGHLEGHTWFNTKDPWVELPELKSDTGNRSYCNI